MWNPDALKSLRLAAGWSRNRLIVELYHRHGVEIAQGTVVNWETGACAPAAQRLSPLASLLADALSRSRSDVLAELLPEEERIGE